MVCVSKNLLRLLLLMRVLTWSFERVIPHCPECTPVEITWSSVMLGGHSLCQELFGNCLQSHMCWRLKQCTIVQNEVRTKTPRHVCTSLYVLSYDTARRKLDTYRGLRRTRSLRLSFSTTLMLRFLFIVFSCVLACRQENCSPELYVCPNWRTSTQRWWICLFLRHQ